MGIADELTAIRRDFPGCRVATFVDLSSGIVLFASTEVRVPQERLDAFCRRAAKLFSGPPGSVASALIGAPVHQAVVPEGEGVLVVLRSRDDPGEAVICHCDADIDLAALTARAAGVLATLGAAS